MKLKSIVLYALFLVLGFGLNIFKVDIIYGMPTPRAINPDFYPPSGETELDRYFRLGYNAGFGLRFDEAIANYQKAANLTTDPCDKKIAEAGIAAARTVMNYPSPPTKLLFVYQTAFVGTMGELTESLPCATVIPGGPVVPIPSPR